jgi:nicotinamide riboside kinase
MGFNSPEVDAVAASRRCDLYLLTDVDIPFVQDGLRDGEQIRGWMHQRFADELARRDTPFVLISGNREERLRVAIAACDDLRSAAPRAKG